MKYTPMITALLAVMTTAPLAQAATQALPAYAMPAISPDARDVAFVSDGQIWEAPANGGAARILVGRPADGNQRPIYSPDGKALAFQKTRGPARGIYVLDLGDGRVTRITWGDGNDVLDDWSADGRWLYLSSARNNVDSPFHGVFRVSASGGTPMPLVNGMYKDEEMSAISPDGHTLAFSFGGLVGWQWWRDGSSHIDTGAVWTTDLKGDASHFVRRTPDDARAAWPMWGGTDTLYYVSDRDGHENIWRSDREGRQTQLTHFADGRVLWPRIDARGDEIVFERGQSVWKLDLDAGQVAKIDIHRRGGANLVPDHWQKVDGQITASSLSPDGKRMALVAEGHLLVGDTAEPYATLPLDVAVGEIASPTWSPDGDALVYVARRNGHLGLYRYVFASGREQALAADAHDYQQPHYSPDGTHIAFLRDQRDLGVISADGGMPRYLAHDRFGMPEPLAEPQTLAWSPDGRWIAYLAIGEREFVNAKLVSLQGGKSVVASDLGHTAGGDLHWSPRGDSLYFVSGQRTEPAHIARVRVATLPPHFTTDALEHDVYGVRHRDVAHFDGVLPSGENVELLPVDADVTSVTPSADGKWLVYTVLRDEHEYLYAMPVDPVSPDAVKVRLTLPDPQAKPAHFLDPEVAEVTPTSDGKHIYYNQHGAIRRIDLDLTADHLADNDVKREAVAFDGQIKIEFQRQKMLEFDQLWDSLRDAFFDGKRIDTRWSTLHDQYAPYVAGVQDTHSLYRLFDLMIGGLNSSHSGAFEPDDDAAVAQARLGITFDRAGYERNGALRVASVVTGGPAQLSSRIHAGDQIVSINGRSVSVGQDINALLANQVGKLCRVGVLASGHAGKPAIVDLKPIAAGAEHNLYYASWVAFNREYLRKATGGKVGYLHLRDMGEGSLAQFYRDINPANTSAQAVVVDVRNNFGGFVNSYVLDALQRHGYIYMQPRGFDGRDSARAILGQRSLERPTVLLTNRVTLSDGEDFTEGYRDLGLGKVVGEDTAGWIIYTSGRKLLDGGAVRLPFIRITGANGGEMEDVPRKVDVHVPSTPSNGYTADDGYLQQALRVLNVSSSTTDSEDSP